MPGLLLRIDAVNLFLFGHLHVGFMALSEVVHLRTHKNTIQIYQRPVSCLNFCGVALKLLATYFSAAFRDSDQSVCPLFSSV